MNSLEARRCCACARLFAAALALGSLFALSSAAHGQVFGGEWLTMPETPEVIAQKLDHLRDWIPDMRNAIDKLRARIDAGDHVKPFTNRWGETITPSGDNDVKLLANMEEKLNQYLAERQRLQGLAGPGAPSSGTTLTGERLPPGARPGSEPTGAVRPEGGSPRTMQVRPGAGAAGEAEAAAAGRAAAAAGAEGEAAAAGRAAGGRVAGAAAVGVATAGVDYYICRQEGKTHAECLVETGAGALFGAAAGTAIGAGIALLPPAAAAAAVATLVGVSINLAANRLAGAPAAAAEREFQAELERRFHELFPRLSAGVEARVAAVEKLRQQLETARQAPHSSAVQANRSALDADSNLAALKGELASAGSLCGVPQELADLEGDFAKRVEMLEKGLNAAAGMVASCVNRADVVWAKELYQTGLGVVAEMTLKAQRVDKAQSALQTTRASAEGLLASAQTRAQTIAGNAEAAATASAAAGKAAANVGAVAGRFGSEYGAAQGLVASFSGWFPARPEVQQAVAGWTGRLAAAAKGAQEAGGSFQADIDSARTAASNAAARSAEAQGLLSDTKTQVDTCIREAEAAVNALTAAAAAATAAATGTLDRFSELPQQADRCIARLDAPPRTLLSLHVSCPAKAFVNDTVSCTAAGVYSDNVTQAEDLTGGPWDVGPVFTSQTPGSVTVRVARGSLSDAAVVLFEARPEAKPAAKPPAPYDPLADPNYRPPGTPTQVGTGRPPGAPAEASAPPFAPAGEPPRQLGGGAKPQPGAYAGETPPATTAAGATAASGPVWCWSDALQAYYQAPMYPCPPTTTKPIGSPPPRWTDLKPLPPRATAPVPATGATGAAPSTGSTPPATKPPTTSAPPATSPPRTGATCGPGTSCTCGDGRQGHISCDFGTCHCGSE